MSAQSEAAPVDVSKDWQPFFELHRAQLEHLGLPKSLWKSMHAKLMTNKRLDDPDQPFAVERAPPEVSGFQLRATKKLTRWGDVWVVPHVISGTKQEIFDELVRDPKGCKYLWNMMDLDNVVEEDPENVQEEDVTASSEEKKQEGESKADKTQENKTQASADTPVTSINPASLQTKPVTDSAKTTKVTPDPVMIEVLLSQVEGLSREDAEKALIETNNDLLEALHVAGPRTELHDLSDQAAKKYGAALGNTTSIESAEKRHAEKQKLKQEASEEAKVPEENKQSEENKKPEATSSSDAKKLSREEIVNLRRAKTVFECLFRFGYVGSYYVAKPRNTEGVITQDEVITKYYVMSPMGSAINVSDEPNVRIVPFICLTLNNASYSIMWSERDIKEGELITRAPLSLN